ncbi:antitoxin Xre/MbcA/ParS toxin-binding domain-containing protein [Croceibacterium salegens]|uniref:antitoxin Xre/MbcA/ParS toxin-binding domain-containing protein n=1 Tax=Croceibacterium salegens TaxID=1737568 RepID=UPI001F3AF4E6|nr:antitoxin Xre/MbcA/ParS toxin-binding domain-containing protein [Croceibacterium salegens]
MTDRTSPRPRLAPDSARRQGEITRLALVLLGREGALEFLNGQNAGLGARPLDLAIASEGGRARVETELRRMTCREDGSGEAIR